MEPKSSEINSAYYTKLTELYDLDSCMWWIKNNKFKKVCLQFPDSMLIDSIDIAEYIEYKTSSKIFTIESGVMPSCCADEVQARNLNCNALIHFGYSCLSPVNIPVYYVFNRRPLNIKYFLQLLEDINLTTPTLILYDVGYFHLMDDLRDSLIERKRLKDTVCIADTVLQTSNIHYTPCSMWCHLRTEKGQNHHATRLQRAYCFPPRGTFVNLIFLGDATATLYNISQVFKECKIKYYSDANGFKDLCRGCLNKKIDYLLTTIRQANTIGIIVNTLLSRDVREALDHAVSLCEEAGKNTFVISMIEPDISKLSNFSDIEIFVNISCPESDLEVDPHRHTQMVGIYELDLAIDSSRSWPVGCTRDFREVANFVPSSIDIRNSGNIKLISPDSSEGSEDNDESDVLSITSYFSISTASIVRIATTASMRAAKHGTIQADGSSHKKTYNINKLMTQQLASRNAQSIVHQRNEVNEDDRSRMMAFQVSQKKAAAKDPFIRTGITKQNKEDFWAKQQSKSRTTTVLDRLSLHRKQIAEHPQNNSNQPSSQYYEREQRIDKKLMQIESLSQEVAKLIESQNKHLSVVTSTDKTNQAQSSPETSHYSVKIPDRRSIEQSKDAPVIKVIPTSVLRKLTRVSSENEGNESKDNQPKND